MAEDYERTCAKMIWAFAYVNMGQNDYPTHTHTILFFFGIKLFFLKINFLEHIFRNISFQKFFLHWKLVSKISEWGATINTTHLVNFFINFEKCSFHGNTISVFACKT